MRTPHLDEDENRPASRATAENGAKESESIRPSWITPNLVEDTIKVWQPRYESPLTEDEAVAIILQVVELYVLIAGCDNSK